MPYKDPDQKREWSKRWRRQSIHNGYGKWLYERRKLRYIDAEKFREALEQISEVGDLPAARIALNALKESQKREDALGPSPRTSLKNQKVEVDGRAEGDTLAEALRKLGLT